MSHLIHNAEWEGFARSTHDISHTFATLLKFFTCIILIVNISILILLYSIEERTDITVS
ncbi:uncharacterized protein TrAFT101_001189 [Trichoderma asperellum]|uniref:uncharacterized protein n=1 Tax=Trichoderma asperellum TaxID=101201 RepID=UPI0033226CA3|nr:hypothetical protein TrAFT101_001189 [Trichoderma asperellum]